MANGALDSLWDEVNGKPLWSQCMDLVQEDLTPPT